MLNSYAILYNYVSLYAVIVRFKKFYVGIYRNPIIRSINLFVKHQEIDVFLFIILDTTLFCILYII